MDTKALRQLTYGLNLVTARDATRRAMGCAGRFALACLTQDATMDLIGTFGFHSSAELDKFAPFKAGETSTGVPYVRTAVSSVVSCSVVTALEIGTHVVLIGEVEDAEVLDGAAEPLT